MKAMIVQFRRGRHTYKPGHFIINVSAKSRKDAVKFVGKEVVWKSSSGKEIKGKIAAPHGNKGLVRAIFERGLPGQAVASEVEVK
ncbi:50S ribosomal protein L35ae [Candidatus Pacearchaeota archaeon]|nr:50S ribosomal protein L35ae [Candidatus Pacearchaeota archaeon]